MKNIEEVLMKLKRNFSFMNINDKDFLREINKKIELNSKNTTTFYDDLYDILAIHYFKMISYSVDSNDLTYIYSFINNNIKYSRKIEKNIDSASYFITFLKCVDDVDNKKEKYAEVLKKSNIMSKIINSITDKFGVAYSDFIDDNSLIDLIDYYCEVNNIELKIELNMKDYDDEDLSSESIYDMYSKIDEVRKYILEISKIPLLTIEEERQLAIDYYDNHNMNARKKLIEHNLRLCLKPASKYNNKGVPFMDLVEDANMGLIKAVDRFNPHKGYKLSTYALYWIYQTLALNFNTHAKLIVVPIRMQDKINNYVKMKNDLSIKIGREPTYKELSEACKLDLKRICLFEDLLKPIISINAPITEENVEYEDIIADSNNVDFLDSIYNEQLRKKILSVMNNLTLNQRMVILIKYGFYDGYTHTLEETAKIIHMLGITENIVCVENIRQIEKRALGRFRREKNIKKLTKFID